MQAPDITSSPRFMWSRMPTRYAMALGVSQVISEYLLKTLRVNFDYIDKYPHYVFNWTAPIGTVNEGVLSGRLRTLEAVCRER